MLVIEDSFVDELINLYVPKQILDKDPIIAGGFVAAIYTEYLRHKDTEKGQQFKDCIFPEKNSAYQSKHEKFHKYFSDIDIFFLGKDYMLLSKIEDDYYAMYPARSKVHKPKELCFDLDSFSFTKIRNKFDGYLNVTKHSSLALSLEGTLDFCPITYQIIFNITSSPESLINNFDINLCKIAYHNRKIYIHDDFLKGHEMKLTSISKKITQTDELLWAYDRVIKYKNRNEYDVDINLQKEMIMKYSEIYDFVHSDTVAGKIKKSSAMGPITIFATTGPANITMGGSLSDIFHSTIPYITTSATSTSGNIFIGPNTSSSSATSLYQGIAPSYNYEDKMNKYRLECNFNKYKDYILPIIKKCDINTLYYITDCNDPDVQTILNERFDEVS